MTKILINSNNNQVIIGNDFTLANLVSYLDKNIQAKLIQVSEIKESFRKTIIIFYPNDNAINKEPWVIEIENKYIDTSKYAKELLNLIKMCPNHITYSTKGSIIKKCAKTVTAAVTIAATIGAAYGVGVLIDKVLEQEQNIKLEREKELYTDSNGVDMRTYPSYSDKGYWIDEYHYIDENGIKWVKSNDGHWFEMGEVVLDNMTQEELEERRKGL